MQLRQFNDVEKQVIEAYLDLCFEGGITQVTLQKVAKRAGLAFSSARYYFSGEGKASVEASTVQYVLQNAHIFIEINLQNTRATLPFDGLLQYIVVMLNWGKEFPKHGSFLVYFFYLSSTALAKFMPISNSDLVATARRRIQSLYYEAVGQGLYPSIENVEKLTVQMHAYLFGRMGLYYSSKLKNESDFEEIQKDTYAVWKMMIEHHRPTGKPVRAEP